MLIRSKFEVGLDLLLNQLLEVCVIVIFIRIDDQLHLKVKNASVTCIIWIINIGRIAV